MEVSMRMNTNWSKMAVRPELYYANHFPNSLFGSSASVFKMMVIASAQSDPQKVIKISRAWHVSVETTLTTRPIGLVNLYIDISYVNDLLGAPPITGYLYTWPPRSMWRQGQWRPIPRAQCNAIMRGFSIRANNTLTLFNLIDKMYLPNKATFIHPNGPFIAFICWQWQEPLQLASPSVMLVASVSGLASSSDQSVDLSSLVLTVIVNYSWHCALNN